MTKDMRTTGSYHGDSPLKKKIWFSNSEDEIRQRAGKDEDD